jgi:hypothetical protein
MLSSYSAFARFATALALLCMATVVSAQNYRSFPADAKRAELNFSSGVLTLNNKAVKTMPGTQIRNEANIIIPPGMVPVDAPVKYQLDHHGYLWRAWILSKNEAAQADKNPQQQTLPVPLPANQYDRFTNRDADSTADSGDPLASDR